MSRQQQRVDYCAIMPDSVGLYVGNPVTQMGYPIGMVKAISATARDVRVDFTVTENRRLPADVRAVTRSTSILANRALELVGNFTSRPQLPPGGCIPLERSATPKSLSEIIGSANTFLNAITPDGSTNIGGVVRGVDQALRGGGRGVNRLLSTSSSVLDAPDQAVSDIRSTMVNLALLTTTLRDIRGPLKDIMLTTYKTTSDIVDVLEGGGNIVGPVVPLVGAAADIENNLTDEVQGLLNDAQYFLRKASAHANLLTYLGFLRPAPVIINKLENFVNRKQFNIRYRPPLYRVATPIDGLLTCGAMNSTSPGSCTDVAGKPYAVDVALLQYVLAKAAKR